jgi:hypothetical protein
MLDVISTSSPASAGNNNDGPFREPGRVSPVAHDDGYTANKTSMSVTPDEVDALRRELEQLRAMQTELMQLLKLNRPDRIVHDIRNLLQERIFLEAATRRSQS